MVLPQRFTDPDHMLRFHAALANPDAPWMCEPGRVAALYLLTGKEELWQFVQLGISKDEFAWLELLDLATEPMATLLLIAAILYTDDHEGDVGVQLCRLWETLSDKDCELVMGAIQYRRRLLNSVER